MQNVEAKKSLEGGGERKIGGEQTTTEEQVNGKQAEERRSTSESSESGSELSSGRKRRAHGAGHGTRRGRRRPAGRVVKRPRRPPAPRRARQHRAHVCRHCGHHCCRRRFEEMRKTRSRRRRPVVREKLLAKGSRGVQAGSQCAMLSPLCTGVGGAHTLHNAHVHTTHAEITPEMIVESLRWLTKWRQDVSIYEILLHMKRRYPVQEVSEALLEELAEKLRVAEIAGIVCRTSAESWSLSGALSRRALSDTHVTLFWDTYGDTMTPLARHDTRAESQKQDKSETATKSTNMYI